MYLNSLSYFKRSNFGTVLLLDSSLPADMNNLGRCNVGSYVLLRGIFLSCNAWNGIVHLLHDFADTVWGRMYGNNGPKSTTAKTRLDNRKENHFCLHSNVL